jgi:hypothetical protein
MENERIMQLEKKKQEKEYFTKMIQENERNLDIARAQKAKEREDDIRDQEAYARKLDKEE